MVSVIIPVYNGARFLAAAIESVLEQHYQPLEIIVVDDGSCDETHAVIMSFGERVHAIKQANAGPAAARNHGVRLAKGELLAFLDADDWWRPDKLARQVAIFLQSPEVGYVISQMHVHQEVDIVWPVSLNQAHYRSEPPCFLPSALIVRRSTFLQIGPFDERYRYSDDADWFMRAKDAGVELAIVPEPLVYKRIHHTNLSHNPAMARETLRAVWASAQRQRLAQVKAV